MFEPALHTPAISPCSLSGQRIITDGKEPTGELYELRKGTSALSSLASGLVGHPLLFHKHHVSAEQ